GDHRALHSFPTRRSSDLLPVDSLPRFQPGWYAEKRREPSGLRRVAPPRLVGRRDIEHVRRSIRRTFAVSGQGGHDSTFAVTCERSEEHTSELQSLAYLVC